MSKIEEVNFELGFEYVIEFENFLRGRKLELKLDQLFR